MQIDFLKLRRYLGWCAVVLPLLAHLLVQGAAVSEALPQYEYKPEWWNPHMTLTEVFRGNQSYTYFEAHYLPAGGDDIFETAIAIARILFWFGILAFLAYCFLRVSLKQKQPNAALGSPSASRNSEEPRPAAD
jgi:hypothetical protein